MRTDKAEAQYCEQKTNTMEEYHDCTEKAEDDPQKLDACERLIPVD